MITRWAKYIINAILEAFHQWWYKVRSNQLKKEIKEQKKEADNAKQKSDNLVSDFEHSLKLYRDSQSKSVNSSKSQNGSSKSIAAAHAGVRTTSQPSSKISDEDSDLRRDVTKVQSSDPGAKKHH